VALLLKRRGIVRVRPLEGGIASWMALKFPVSDLAVAASAATPDASRPADGGEELPRE